MGGAVNTLSHKRILRNVLLTFLVAVVFIAVLFAFAGSLAWFWGWILAGIMIVANVTGILLLAPGLLEERTCVKSGYKRWDILLASIIGRLGPLAVIITAGLDFHFGWSGAFPLMLPVLGLVLCISGYVFSLWAMRENKFFSSVVRIQKERGHHVITTGPYQIVRHPGYSGSIMLMVALPFVLTSYWALIPAVITVIVSFVRTVLEDNTLKRELAGYSRYAERVRYRLISGIW
ncbi:MAG: isoprenylcysteine carboxylmethyltransferase family protein [Dehalococcoidales bacterium]|nr:isoprenylcysteine carboxylmethyltransferase family protein [Dehalococcoidales bacterium]